MCFFLYGSAAQGYETTDLDCGKNSFYFLYPVSLYLNVFHSEENLKRNSYMSNRFQVIFTFKLNVIRYLSLNRNKTIKKNTKEITFDAFALPC